MKPVLRQPDPPTGPPPRLTPRQFAQAIGKSLRFVMALIDAGELEVEDVSSPGASLPRYQIDPAQAEAWRRSRRRRPRRAPTVTAPPAPSKPKHWPDVTDVLR